MVNSNRQLAGMLTKRGAPSDEEAFGLKSNQRQIVYASFSISANNLCKRPETDMCVNRHSAASSRVANT
eukprot:4956008-Lingulodinium_polyedra.AAC.1